MNETTASERAVAHEPALKPQRERRLIADSHAALNPFAFALLSVLLGIATGFGALGFRLLIAFVHNLAFSGRVSALYNANQHTPASPLGAAVILVPVLGAAIVAYVVARFAPEARGHGVPEVMDAIYYHKCEIRPAVAVVKSLASALSIGTGGSVGREGPIIQIGASFASLTGRLARASRWQRATLVAAGGGAGIAATFNTPIGGVLFAVEVLLHEVSVRTLVPVALATTTATFVGRALFGNVPAFPLETLPPPSSAGFDMLPASIVLGALMAVASVVFIRSLYGAEDWFERVLPRRVVLRHVIGMFGVGAIIYTLMRCLGHYYVEGVGYATIMDTLTGALSNVWLLLLLALLKLTATCMTLGSGASGGIFSPSLFMGATLGAAYGFALHALFPSMPSDPQLFVLAGMAALVAGATSAALTAVVMMFEMTLNYSVILPLTLAVAVSYGLRRAMLPYSIYTMKLARRGHVMPEALQANAHLVHHVADIALTDVQVLPADAPPARLQCESEACAYVVVRESEIVGTITCEWLLGHRAQLERAQNVGQLAMRDMIVAPFDMTVFELMAALQRTRASIAVVTGKREERGAPATSKPPRILGIVTKAHLAEALAEGMELFGD